MKVVIFGATGMIGQGVLRECLLSTHVERVLTIGRTAVGVKHPKLLDLQHADLFHYGDVEDRLTGNDACFFCLGVSSVGMAEKDYARITYDLTMAAANVLCRLNPHMVFTYVSGAGTDSSEQGRTMWARVKGRTENALLRLPFAAAYMFRPGAIEPIHGVRSKTALYNVGYALAKPFMPVLRRLLPNFILTTEQVGRAMLNVAAHGYPSHVLEIRDIRRAGESGT